MSVKRQSHKSDSNVSGTTNHNPDTAEGESKKLKRKIDSDVTEIEITETRHKRHKKRSKTDVDGKETAQGLGVEAEGKSDAGGLKRKKEKKEKKRSAHKSTVEIEAPIDNKVTAREEGTPTEVDAEHKKRKRRNKTGFPDPSEDASLSDQASKALAYAFAQFHRPRKWKFNKARQNWIIRNWTSDMIPEIYLPLVTAYLSKVQGGVRDSLVKLCQTALEPEPSKPDSIQAGTAEDVAQSDARPTTKDQHIVVDAKKIRAQHMLQALKQPATVQE